MTQTSHLKSASITNLDAQPILPNTAGEGGPGIVREVSDFVTSVSGDLAGTTYQLVRIPTNAVVKNVRLSWAAASGGKVQLSVYYSDSTNLDGTASANVSSPPTIVPTTGSAFFSGDIDLTSAAGWTDETFANAANSGSYTQSMINQHLWQALGLATDPGGFFDIVAVVHTTTITTGALIAMSVSYID
jgi:hypothetical protein